MVGLAIAGVILAATGAIGIMGSCIMEWRTNAKMWEVLMKVFSLIFGVGGILFGIAMTV